MPVASHGIGNVSFSVLSDDEICRISVKRIHRPYSFDQVGHPVSGGLYDPALGPLDFHTSCQTCGLQFTECPGHVGHIALPVTVCNPISFPTLFKILQLICFNCGRLCVAKKSKESIVKELEEWKGIKSGVAGGKRNKLFAQLLENKTNSCTHCSFHSAKLRKQRNSKVILEKFSEKMAKKNIEVMNSKRVNQLESDGDDEIVDDEAEDQGGEEDEERLDEMITSSIENKINSVGSRILFPTEMLSRLADLWKSLDGKLMKLIFADFYSGNEDESYKAFFMHNMMVPASKYRPCAKSGATGQKLEHAMNTVLNKIIETSNDMIQLQNEPAAADSESSNHEELTNLWISLQDSVNMLHDFQPSASDKMAVFKGMKQKFDKKHGLFRSNMMGKRVNFAARSVISPDVNLRTDEIGIPEIFAKKLTYPTPVTAYNVEKLRQAVINGPDVHPGANFIEDDQGRQISLAKKSKRERIALSNSLLAGEKTQKVLRHLESGDVLLVNRQPTLHKPGIMAHKARVLKGEQTIRMHYANCNTYNADFDGDEMNLHFPQDEVARAEAYLIACTANQYLVPKDGSPLRGLIQDHVVSGVLITKKDTFFTQEQFQQYLHIACQDICGPTKKIVFPDPVILKPKKLWTGKQIITGVLMNLTHGSPPLSLKGKTKIPGECWGTSTIEAVVRIRNNELLHGVLDKSQFGATQYGLIHAIYELYGGDAAGTMLTCLGRLFSSFIQIQRAFTCGLDDFLLANKAEDNRLNLLKNSYKVSLGASAEFAKDLLPKDIEIGSQNQKLISDALRQKLSREDSSASQTPSSVLDSKVKGAMNDVTSGVIKVALNASSDGLRKPFPFNNLALMTLSGAKGSNVNFSQISCLLGQQELEGKRVPRTTVGRTLPSFSSYDPSAKAGGFITNRFLTGIRPQEYYFHCMAGREGLVDTAVKTSRSGYLQRCLIKHLENVKVHYDQTVRDESRDSQIIQFNYGEDSVDVSNASYLYNQSKFDFLVENYAAVLKNLNPAGAIQVLDTESARKYRKKIRKQRELEGPLDDPVMSKLSSSDCLGSVSEAFESKVNEFVSKNASVLEKENLSQAKFEAMMWLKYLKSLIHPGEAVGVLTGQSVGEPSTQMTLNTFHLAGFGGANVTLGIPRLREIIMTAASKISTPLMQIYLQDSYGLKTKDSAEKLASALQKVTLNDICDGVDIKEKCNMETEKREIYIRVYYVEALLKKFGISLKKLQRVVKKVFIPLLQKHSSSEAKSKRKKKVVEDDIDDVDVEDRASKVQESTEGKEEDEGKASNEKDSDSEESESDKSESDDSDEDGEDSEVLETLPNEMSIPEELEGELVELSANLMGYDKLRFFTTYFEVQLVVDLNTEYLLSMNSVEQCCRNTVLTQISGISDCYITQPDDPLFAKSGEYAIQTDGANFDSIWMLEALHPELKIDLNRIYTNDISLILARYGVEAARNAIVKEIRSVFSVYGISVNPRHLFLLADFMASEGGFRALNRYGIKNASSPILKVTFETSSNFLTDALLFGEYDSLDTVSSRIFTGRPVNVGTGSFDLLQPLVL